MERNDQMPRLPWHLIIIGQGLLVCVIQQRDGYHWTDAEISVFVPVSPLLSDFFIRCFSNLLPARLTSWAQTASMGSVKGRFCTLKETPGSWEKWAIKHDTVSISLTCKFCWKFIYRLHSRVSIKMFVLVWAGWASKPYRSSSHETGQ